MIGDITTFLFGSAVALFIALLGWSEQIRTPHKETKELEQKFMEKKGITWDDLRATIRESTAAKKITAYTNLIEGY